MKKELLKNKDTNRAIIESLRPHFVFNEMNILRYMIKKDPEKASDMVYDLSIYMRCKIGVLEDDEITTLENEWNFVRAYLSLEKVSLSNLEYALNVENPQCEIKRGALLEGVEKLVKEQVRATKEPRTIYITNCDDNGQPAIKLIVKETDVCIQL